MLPPSRPAAARPRALQRVPLFRKTALRPSPPKAASSWQYTTGPGDSDRSHPRDVDHRRKRRRRRNRQKHQRPGRTTAPGEAHRPPPSPPLVAIRANILLRRNPPMTYPGGKEAEGTAQTIINEQPPHDTYVEPFAGHAAVLRAKRPALNTIVIDRDPDATAWLAGHINGNVQLLTADALEWLPRQTFTRRTLIYCDPPYLIRSRAVQRPRYRYELTEEDHERLLSILTSLPCMVQISAYADRLSRSHLRRVAAPDLAKHHPARTRHRAPLDELPRTPRPTRLLPPWQRLPRTRANQAQSHPLDLTARRTTPNGTARPLQCPLRHAGQPRRAGSRTGRGDGPTRSLQHHQRRRCWPAIAHTAAPGEATPRHTPKLTRRVKKRHAARRVTPASAARVRLKNTPRSSRRPCGKLAKPTKGQRSKDISRTQGVEAPPTGYPASTVHLDRGHGQRPLRNQPILRHTGGMTVRPAGLIGPTARRFTWSFPSRLHSRGDELPDTEGPPHPPERQSSYRGGR